MNKSSFLKRLLPLVLCFVLVLTSVTIAAPAEDGAEGSKAGFTWEKVETGTIEGLKPGHAEKSSIRDDGNFILKGDVRVSIIVDGRSTMEAGYETKGIGSNDSAKRYRGEILARQKRLAQKISNEALGGKTLDVVWNLTLAANVISANVPAVKISAIKAVDGVKDVIIENQYSPSATIEPTNPDMSNASGMTGAQTIWSSGYTGAGSIVAIIDTGIDTDHQSFAADSFGYAIAQVEQQRSQEDEDYKVDLLDVADIEKVYDQLNIKDVGSASDFYLTSKIPFAVNYVDQDLDVTHDNDKQGEHGSHVAGIAAANRYVKIDGKFTEALDSVLTQGEAPDAQILAMKVFGKGGGAYDSDYMAAIEDAILLGADAINLSLGSANAGLPFDTYYAEVLDEMAKSDSVVTISQGNSGSWADNTYGPGYLYSDDANLNTGGSPGSYANAFTVASVDNDGFTGAYLLAGENKIYYTESLKSNEKIITIAQEEPYDFVYIDGPGVITDDNDNIIADQFAAVEGGLEGKIAICNRGGSYFYMKANAAVESGATAAVIANNQAGTISMALDDYKYTAPVVSITQADGALLKGLATSSKEMTYPVITGYDEATGEAITEDDTVTVYYGTLIVGSSAEVQSYDADYYTMSDFSSWGVPGDLSLKPEITAPGGNIYSVNGLTPGGADYENMSGTSMAAPQIAGLVAVLNQYIRENGLAEKTGLSERQLATSLLMSTAQPLIEEDSEYYYSVLKQGAGLVDLNAAVNSRTYIMMDSSATATASDGKVKVELGDDPERTGKYSAEFTVYNMADEAVEVYFDADFFTQDVFQYYTYDAEGGALVDEEGNPVYSYYLDTWTYPLANDVKWYLEGEAFEDEAVTILANGSVSIKAEITISDAANYDDKGTFIEGYIYASEEGSADGAEGVTHSIPVLGYYGSWAEPSMTDKGSALEYGYGYEYRVPYMYQALGEAALSLEAFQIRYAGGKDSFAFGGNPYGYGYDAEYMPDRNAMSSNDTITGYRFSPIRNSIGAKVSVDNNSEVLYENEGGGAYAAYYDDEDAKWYNTTATVRVGYTPEGVAEDTALNVNVTLAPEYYLDTAAEEAAVNWKDPNLLKYASTSLPFVIDDSDPKVTDVKADEEAGTITVTVKDNQYIAAIGLYTEDDEQIYVNGSNAQAAKGAEATYTFDISENDADHLYISVGDYAANESLYKINLNPEELDSGVLSVTVDPAEAQITKGRDIKLTAIVEPWGIDDRVTWTSSDETVATVDETGIVIGIAPGTVTITATSVADPTMSGTCEIEVLEFNKELNGVVWDEEGKIWFSKFNLNSLPEYTKLANEPADAQITSVCYDQYGNLFAASFDSEEWLSDLYLVDEETYELTMIGGSSEIGYMDIAPVPSLDGYLAAVYGPYLVIVDANTGDYLGVLDYSEDTGGNYLVGITYEESGYEPDIDAFADFYLLVDETGEMYEAGLVSDGEGIYDYGLYDIGPVGYETDTPYFQSLYYDSENLYWSLYNEADDDVNIVLTDFENAYDAGSFESKVWPVGGLYEQDVYPQGPVRVESISLEESSLEMFEGESETLIPVIEPEDATDQVVFWESSDPEVAAVDEDGNITALKEGVATVVVTTEEGGKTAVCTVIVKAVTVPVEEVTLDKTSLTMDPGAEESLKAEVAPEDATNPAVNWSSSNKAVATVDENGKVTAVAPGVATIIVTTADGGKTATCTVTVKEEEVPDTTVAVTGVKLDKTSMTLKEGENGKLTAAITPENATNKKVYWSCSDSAVAGVDASGKVTAVKAGKATVTVTTVDGGKSASCEITVEAVPEEESKDIFPDVTADTVNKTAYNAIYWAVENGIVKGYSDGTFQPENICTREQFSIMLWRFAGEPAANANDANRFSDAADFSSNTSKKAVAWALEQGVVAGFNDGTFRPKDDITRAQVAVMLWRFAGRPVVNVTSSAFSDISSFGANVQKSIIWAEGSGIAKGYSNGTFRPNDGCQRQHMAIFLYRFNKNVKAYKPE